MSHLYLHGFASSPHGRKARVLSGWLRESGIEVSTPDLNLPDFERLTISAMVAHAESLLRPGMVVWGSSLGGYLATVLAARNPTRVRALVLLAPAVDFPTAFPDRFEAEAVRLRAGGTIRVMHHGTKREHDFTGALLDDCPRWPSLLTISCPALVLAASRDAVLDTPTIARWAARQPHTTYEALETDHEMGEALPLIQAKAAAWLQAHGLTEAGRFG